MNSNKWKIFKFTEIYKKLNIRYAAPVYHIRINNIHFKIYIHVSLYELLLVLNAVKLNREILENA